MAVTARPRVGGGGGREGPVRGGTDRSQVDSGVWDLGAGSVNPAVIPESLAV